MNCQKFQEVLPYIIESGGNEEEEGHLRTCPHCAELVQDLKYIATQAKLLLPMHDPSPRVWAGIEQSLHRQGLISEGRPSLMGQITTTHSAQTKSWTPLGWALAAIALMGFSLLLINYRPQLPSTRSSTQNVSAPAAAVETPALEAEDQQLVAQVSQQSPAVGRATPGAILLDWSYFQNLLLDTYQPPTLVGSTSLMVKKAIFATIRPPYQRTNDYGSASCRDNTIGIAN